jgi:hypothetical protein
MGWTFVDRSDIGILAGAATIEYGWAALVFGVIVV